MFLIKVRTVFNAALRLYRPELSDEENFAAYGPCSNPHGHGHNYTLEVAVAGTLDPETGMVTDFYALSQLVKTLIFDKVDHQNLNTDVEFLKGDVPTSENLALRFWQVLEPHVQGTTLFSITVSERNNNIVTYYGPKATLADVRSASGMSA